MKAFVRVLLIMGGLVFVFCLVGAGLLWYWWSHNGRELLEQGQSSIAAGQATGAGTDQQGCLDGALAKLPENTRFSAQLSNTLFLSGCLPAAQPTPGFCDGVPPNGEVMNSVRWRLEKCKDRPQPESQPCGQLYGEVQKFCSRKDRKQ